MKATQIHKYETFLTELYYDTRFSPLKKSMTKYCQDRKISNSIGSVLTEAGIIKNLGTRIKPEYTWDTIAPTHDMAVKVLNTVNERIANPKPMRRVRAPEGRYLSLDSVLELLPDRFTSHEAREILEKEGKRTQYTDQVLSRLYNVGKLIRIQKGVYVKKSAWKGEKNPEKKTVLVHDNMVRAENAVTKPARRHRNTTDKWHVFSLTLFGFELRIEINRK